jgi:hypothetical protein
VYYDCGGTKEPPEMSKNQPTSTTEPTPIWKNPIWKQYAPNASALPVSGAALTILLRDTVISIEVRSLLAQYASWNDDARVAVVDVYRRLTPSERFRLHNALHGMLSYVPVWLQEVTA